MRPAPTPPSLSDLVGQTIPKVVLDVLIDDIENISRGGKMAAIYNGAYLLIERVDDVYNLSLTQCAEDSISIFGLDPTDETETLVDLSCVEFGQGEDVPSFLVDLTEGLQEAGLFYSVTGYNEYEGLRPSYAVEV